MIKTFVKILELLGDRLEVCVSVYLSFLVSLEDNVKMIQTWYALLAKIVIVLQKNI